jgi:protein phosphatase 1L
MKADNNNNNNNQDFSTCTIENDTTVPPSLSSPTLLDYKNTLQRALAQINKEVLRIVHWSYQGSTAVVCWLHETIPPMAGISDKGGNGDCVTHNDPVRTLVAANIGDSRLVLSRDGMAIPLSRDHKPNDPIEMEYIYNQGGQVTYPSGVPRVNGVMALSRAIGDRSEMPCIRAEPDLIVQQLEDNDDFYVLATDGLWDVFSNQEVVSFLQSLYEEGDLSDTARQEITKDLVYESLARGAEDNVTVLVVWLR